MAIRGGTPGRRPATAASTPVAGLSASDRGHEARADSEGAGGAEVSCRILNIFFEELAKRQLPPELLARGSGESAESLTRLSYRISWATFRRVMLNAGRIWSDSELEEIGARIPANRQSPGLVLLSHIFLNPRMFYRWVAGERADRFIRSIEATLTESGAEPMLLELKMRESFEPSREFFVWIKGVLRGLPLVVGGEEAGVRMELSENGASYRILMPDSDSLWMRLRNLVNWPIRTWSIAQELRSVTSDLEERHREIWEREEDVARKTELLQQRDERFSSVFEASPVATMVASVRTGEILEANASFIQLTGLGREQLIGHTPADLDLWPELEGRHAPGSSTREHHTSYGAEVEFTLRSGRTCAALLSVQRLKLAGEACEVWQCVDITSRKSAEEKLRREQESLEGTVAARTRMLERSRRELVESERLDSVGTLAAGIAQQINSPLSAIQSSAEFALVCKDDPNFRKIWEQVLRENVVDAQRCSRIVRSVLQFSRGESAEKWPEDLNELMSRCCKLMDAYALDRKAVIHTDLASEPMIVKLSPIELEQALLNVLRNALESHELGAFVQVIASRRGDWATVEIRDDGRGIPDDELRRIFDPFFTTRVDPAATGLGLSVARSVILDHGGRIHVESEPGRGTTVRVELPAIGDPMVGDPMEGAESSAAKTSELD